VYLFTTKLSVIVLASITPLQARFELGPSYDKTICRFHAKFHSGIDSA
jgi:hypothetical protein